MQVVDWGGLRCLILALALCPSAVIADGLALPPATIPELSTGNRVALAQLQQAVESGEHATAVELLLGMLDQRGDQLVRVAQSEEGFETWIALHRFLQNLLLNSDPNLLATYRRAVDETARQQYASARSSKSLTLAKQTLREFRASSSRNELLLLVADLALESGQFHLARGCLYEVEPGLQYSPVPNRATNSAAISWSDYERLREAHGRSESQQTTETDQDQARNSVDPIEEPLVTRLVMCSVLSGDLVRAKREFSLFREFGWLVNNELESLIDDLGATSTDEASENLWCELLPIWKCLMETPALKERQRFGEWTAIYPRIRNGKVLAHTGDQVLAFDVFTGEPWPSGSEAPLLQYGNRAEDWHAPRHLPASYPPVFRLTGQDDLIGLRLGPSVTGWLPALNQDRTVSNMAILDLRREGSLLSAYPKSLSGDLRGFEFESSPTIIGDRVIVGLTRREGSQYTSRVACFDLQTAERIWITNELAVSPYYRGQPENRVTSSRVVHRDGALYYHSHLGSVSSIELDTGRMNWVVRYPRETSNADQTSTGSFVKRARISGLLSDELIFVAPADCARVFAINAMNGQIQWSSGKEEFSDIGSLVGATENHLIAAGDRLVWIDKTTGGIDAAVASSIGTDDRYNDADSRAEHPMAALGRRSLFWTSGHELLQFDRSLHSDDFGKLRPRVLNRIDLRLSNLASGNLTLQNGVLVLASQHQLAVFLCNEQHAMN